MSNTKDKKEESSQDTDEDIANDLGLHGRQFNKILKRMVVRSKSNFKNNTFDISRPNDAGRRTKSEEKSRQGKGIQCH